MSALTGDQLAYLHSELGDEPTDGDLQDRFDRLDSVRSVVLEVLRERYSTYTRQPGSINVSGVVSVSYAETIAAIEKQMARVAAESPGGPLDDEPDEGLPEIVTARVARRWRR
jgi:hypothetical protein